VKFDVAPSTVDVYPVGVLSDIQAAWRALTVLHRPNVAWYYLRNARRHVWRHVRNHEWRDLRQTFNGYLAEPSPWPSPALRRCGRGWTRKRALRNLNRRIRQAGA
jgi:hypothetical protein